MAQRSPTAPGCAGGKGADRQLLGSATCDSFSSTVNETWDTFYGSWNMALPLKKKKKKSTHLIELVQALLS